MTKNVLVRIQDSAEFFPAIKGVEGAAFYIGGSNAAHTWTDGQIRSLTERYRLPIWVPDYANPTPQMDAAAVIGWLEAHSWPMSKAVMLDMETRVDVALVNEFGDLLQAAGYRTIPYGSLSAIFRNPRRSGYAVADWDGVASLEPGAIIKQYTARPGYDLSEASPAAVAMMLDTQPGNWRTRALGRAERLVQLLRAHQ